MSRERQPQLDEDGIAVRSLALRFPSGHVVEAHTHPWGQLVYATEGVMTVTTPVGDWVVPPSRAAWVPADTLHAIRAADRVYLRTLYVRPDLARSLPRECRVLAVSALLRELILATLDAGYLHERVPEQFRLAGVLLDRVRVTDEVPLQLPWPKDARARRVADRAQANLADPSPLVVLAEGCGASVRTLERLFVRDTRMTFGRWRQQARLLEALRLLAAGQSVTAAGISVGFASTSAFVAMFRRTLGTGLQGSGSATSAPGRSIERLGAVRVWPDSVPRRVGQLQFDRGAVASDERHRLQHEPVRAERILVAGGLRFLPQLLLRLARRQRLRQHTQLHGGCGQFELGDALLVGGAALAVAAATVRVELHSNHWLTLRIEHRRAQLAALEDHRHGRPLPAVPSTTSGSSVLRSRSCVVVAASTSVLCAPSITDRW